MDFCKPAFVTAALFISILILDLAKRDYRLLGGHFLFGIISVLLMLFLCQNEAEYVAWGVLLLPFILLAIGLVIGAIQKTSGEKRGVIVPKAVPAPGPECTCDESLPYSSLCQQHPVDVSGCIVPKVEAKPPLKNEEKKPDTSSSATTTSEKPTCGPTTGLACVNPSVLQSA